MKNHVKEKLSAYLNHELPQAERQQIAEHLLVCEQCRAEHDEIKFGAALASNLQRIDAPDDTWNKIVNALDERKTSSTVLLPQASFFNLRGLLATGLALIAVSALAAIVYLNLFTGKPQEIAEHKTTPIVQDKTNTSLPVVPQTPAIFPANSNAEIPSNTNLANVNPPVQIPQNNSNQIAPKQNDAATFWQVEAISGTPKTGNQAFSKNGTLAVGDFLETDANSRARVQVANIGQVEVAPNSRLQLVKTQTTEHRLSLERGVLHAKILAPPRLFIVDTPSAVAVDLGCEYNLEVDKAGNSRLHVTSGFVALERNGRESIVPAGAICLTNHGKGLGTPFFDDASPALQAALNKFDFAGGGSDALQTIIKESRSYDTLTLWHLLPRVAPHERVKIFEALVAFVKLPSGVTREGVLKLDKKMLEQWKGEIENLWFE